MNLDLLAPPENGTPFFSTATRFYFFQKLGFPLSLFLSPNSIHATSSRGRFCFSPTRNLQFEMGGPPRTPFSPIFPKYLSFFSPDDCPFPLPFHDGTFPSSSSMGVRLFFCRSARVAESLSSSSPRSALSRSKLKLFAFFYDFPPPRFQLP